MQNLNINIVNEDIAANNEWVIVSGGVAPLGKELEAIYQARHLICADSGANHLFRLGVLPELILGDLDSVEQSVHEYFAVQGVRIISYPAKKDITDTQLALDYALENGAKRMTIVAASGGRIDHFLANIQLLMRYNNDLVCLMLVSGDSTAYLCKDTVGVKGCVGDLLSVLPLTPTISKVNLSGLAYPLVDAEIEMGNTTGISNEFISDFATISIGKGTAMIIHTVI